MPSMLLTRTPFSFASNVPSVPASPLLPNPSPLPRLYVRRPIFFRSSTLHRGNARGMASRYSKLGDLIEGTSKCTIRVRVIRSWTAMNVNTGVVFSKDMLLLDEEGFCVHAQIPERIIEKFEKRKSIVDGQIVQIQHFKVRAAIGSHRPVPAEKKIQFLLNTNVYPMSNDPSLHPISALYFNFADLDLIKSRQSNHLLLTDVIGKLESVSPTRHVEAKGVNTFVRDVLLKLNGGSVISVTLWGNSNELLQPTALKQLPHPVIIAAAGVTVSTYQGNPTLNTTTATHFYMNPDVPETTTLKSMFESDNPLDWTAVNNGDFKEDRLGIDRNRTCLADILGIEWTPDFKEERYTVQATIKAIDVTTGWAYNGCGTCNRKITYEGGILFCQKCKQPVSNVSYRYKVVATVFDDTATGEFTMFDDEVVQLIQIPAPTMVVQQSGDIHSLPEQLQNLYDRTFIFEVKVTERNVLEGWKGYTVSKIYEDKSSAGKTDLQSLSLPESDNIPTPKNTDKKRRGLILSENVEQEDNTAVRKGKKRRQLILTKDADDGDDSLNDYLDNYTEDTKSDNHTSSAQADLGTNVHTGKEFANKDASVI